MNIRKFSLRVLFALFLLPAMAVAQLSNIQQKKIDSLFLEWNQPNHPGGVIGIQQGNKISYLKAFGLASLDYLVPNNTGTLFNIASVSKQFTSFGILLLEKEGKLSIDDDIHKFLPELPYFGSKITIRHLMHHTSGLRSFHSLLATAGWRNDDGRTNADILGFMKRQKSLNFEPGEKYLYCNTGYLLMAYIIERVTGKKFEKWMKANVFEPLEMHQTYVEGDYTNIEPGNATSYSGSSKNGFKRSVDYWSYVGSGNIHTTVTDLLKWMRNFSSPKNEYEAIFEKLQTRDVFNNGEINNYALGVVVNDYHGYKRVSHGGSIGGYRSSVLTFPDEELSIVVLTNFSSSRISGKVNKIVDDLLEIKPEGAEKIESAPTSVIKGSSFSASLKQLKEYAGLFYSVELETFYTLYVKDNQLMGHHPRHGDFNIEVISEEKLKADLSALNQIEISRNKKGEVIGLFISNSRAKKLWFEKAVIKSFNTKKIIQD